MKVNYFPIVWVLFLWRIFCLRINAFGAQMLVWDWMKLVSERVVEFIALGLWGVRFNNVVTLRNRYPWFFFFIKVASPLQSGTFYLYSKTSVIWSELFNCHDEKLVGWGRELKISVCAIDTSMRSILPRQAYACTRAGSA